MHYPAASNCDISRVFYPRCRSGFVSVVEFLFVWPCLYVDRCVCMNGSVRALANWSLCGWLSQFLSRYSVCQGLGSWDTWVQILAMPEEDNMSLLIQNHFLVSERNQIKKKSIWMVVSIPLHMAVCACLCLCLSVCLCLCLCLLAVTPVFPVCFFQLISLHVIMVGTHLSSLFCIWGCMCQKLWGVFC